MLLKTNLVLVFSFMYLVSVDPMDWSQSKQNSCFIGNQNLFRLSFKQMIEDSFFKNSDEQIE